jgi:hypothetical protein
MKIKNTLVTFTFYMMFVMAVTHAQTSATIQAFSSLETNASIKILISFTPSPIVEDAIIEMRCINGAGEAIFLPGGNTTTNIHQSGLVTIRGNMCSTIESNMVMEVKIGTNTLTSRIFTVIDIGKISFAQARAIAEGTIIGSVETEADAPTTVELINDYEEFLVTFETVPDIDMLKGKFSARVKIAADSGSVVDGVERAP